MQRAADVLIIGGGFGGLLTAVHLRKQGAQDIVIVERGAEIQAQCRLIAERFGLCDAALLQTRTDTLTWQEATRR